MSSIVHLEHVHDAGHSISNFDNEPYVRMLSIIPFACQILCRRKSDGIMRFTIVLPVATQQKKVAAPQLHIFGSHQVVATRWKGDVDNLKARVEIK